ncbi:cytochrome P450 [Roridomyces roridus]|uniref:Cytochrome P450 n=1 Tax=Roridomyces roridus TaxID=1738132 RepID=A0AAD7B1Y9_9AGAR|nr:cytochrome P450 [Roridomyces roridus]
MDSENKPLLLASSLAAALTAYLLLKAVFRKKHAIPAIIGQEGVLASWMATYKYFCSPAEVVQEGYRKYRDGVFRVPRLFTWDYAVTGAKRVAEVGAAPENVLSFYGGVEDSVQGLYTLGKDVLHDPYHQLTVRTSLTRNIGRRFPEVRDEIICSFDDVFGLQGSEWKRVPVIESVMKITARTSNRLFIGLPLCRNQEYLDLNIRNAVDIFIHGQILSIFPEFIKPIVAPLIVTRKKHLRQMLKFVGPMIEERIAKEDELGSDYPETPNDLISWMLEVAKREQRHAPGIAARMLATNMAAIHTTSMALSHVLFDLTTYPQYIQPLREEAERVVKEEGWSKASLNSMHKIDSFIRESQRLNGSGPVTMIRKVVDPNGFTFSDGIVIPYKSLVFVSAKPVHYDSAFYDNADVFDGYRFSKLREAMQATEADSEKVFNRQIVSTGSDFLVFGHGKHACPGRFFAATELKAMLAHVLITYDVKAEDEFSNGVRPPNFVSGQIDMPNVKAGIMVRTRQ